MPRMSDNTFRSPFKLNDIKQNFIENGYVILEEAFSSDETEELLRFVRESQVSPSNKWDFGDTTWQYSQPLLDTDELDKFIRHQVCFPIIDSLMGGNGASRFSEFNFREIPPGHPRQTMRLHRDRALPLRSLRAPYYPPDYVACITYLTEVSESSPVFTIIPKSSFLQPPFSMSDAIPIYGGPGTMIIYDITLVHTRFDPISTHTGRVTLHQYFSRGGFERGECWDNNLRSKHPLEVRNIARPPAPVLTDWMLIPPRLAASPDKDTRLFYSHWSAAQGEWAALGYPALVSVGSHIRVANYFLQDEEDEKAIVNGIKGKLATSSVYAPSVTQAVLRLLSHYKQTLPSSRNICVFDEAATIIRVADELLGSNLPLQDVANEAYNRTECLPPLLLLALKAAEAKTCLMECPPCHLTVVFPMYREQDRLLPQSEHPEGQDSLGWKIRQMNWLCGVGAVSKYTWDIIAVDDGCDRDSAVVATRMAALSDPSETRVSVLKLADHIGPSGPIPLNTLESTEDSMRGGAIVCGLVIALQQSKTMSHSKEHVILYTDADLQMDLCQAGFFVHRILLGRCSVAAGVRYGHPRSILIKPPNGALSYPASHFQQHNSLQITLRQWFRRSLLPEISYGFPDINCGFKAFRKDFLEVIVPQITQFKKCFDAELLMLCAMNLSLMSSKGAFASKTISPSALLAEFESPSNVKVSELLMADSTGVHSSSRDEFGLGVIPLIFTEDSAVSKSAYETVVSKNRTEIDFLEMIKDVSRLFRFKISCLEIKPSLEEEDVLLLIDSLDIRSYQRLLACIEKHIGTVLPLNHDFNVSELSAYSAGEGDV